MFGRFGIICTILKMWKTPMEEFRHPGFSPATLLKVTLFHRSFSLFFNCTNGTKLRNASHLVNFSMYLHLSYARLKSHFRFANKKAIIRNALISSKTNPRNDSKKEKWSYGKVRNRKTILTILQFIRILYLKQQSNILPCFCSLNIWKRFI